MNLSDISKKIFTYIYWALEKHPGKFIGAFLGFFLGLAFITIGFWKTLILFALTACGYYIGRCWDNKEYPLWLDKILHTILSKRQK
jgi:uncharacterized membrane protein